MEYLQSVYIIYYTVKDRYLQVYPSQNCPGKQRSHQIGLLLDFSQKLLINPKT